MQPINCNRPAKESYYDNDKSSNVKWAPVIKAVKIKEMLDNDTKSLAAF